MTQHTNSLPPVVMKPHIFDDVVLVAVCFITRHPSGQTRARTYYVRPLGTPRECNSTRLLAVDRVTPLNN